MSPRARAALLAAALAVATALPYLQTASFGFVTFDDPGYVRDNPIVVDGLTADGVARAFGEARMANWHPLTWVSHMLDVELFGMDAGAHHLVNVALHALNAALLFLALRALAGGTWRPLVVAALFALHPLRAESVAWISERKDVLSGTFWMLALLAWAHHARAPSPRRLALVATAYALGLLAKPMVVTLPVVLLLLDAWPLRRATLLGTAGDVGETTDATDDAPDAPPRAVATPLRRLLGEKGVLLLIGVAAAVVTVLAQRAGGAVTSLDVTTPVERALNAARACGLYLASTAWPVDLAFFYPHPAQVGRPFLAEALLSLGALVAVSVLAVRLRRSRPWLLVGWLWFLVTVAPVVGLLQVGEAGHADRYTYLPTVGVAIAVVWELADRLRRLPRAAVAGGVVALLAVLGRLTHAQAATWRDSATLYEHALAVTDDNYTAHLKLGELHIESGDLPRAEAPLRAALAIEPRLAQAHYLLGQVHMARGENAAAEDAFRAALDLAPRLSEAHNNLGILLAQSGRLDEALQHLEAAVRSDASNSAAKQNLNVVRGMRQGR